MIIYKSREEIAIIREGGRRLAAILAVVAAAAKPGATTGELENYALSLIDQAGGRPSFKGYKSGRKGELFPTALCTSLNSEVVHAPALPERTLREGDIIGIDVGLEYKGYFTDMAVTVGVGKISKEASRLVDVTRESLRLAIKEVKPGNTVNDIGRAVEAYVRKNGFAVVRELVGHGVGKKVHEEPQVPNFVFHDSLDIELREGMVIAIEPMVNVGRFEIAYKNDPFTLATKDGSLSAHFEHTVAVTEKGCEVMTIL